MFPCFSTLSRRWIGPHLFDEFGEGVGQVSRIGASLFFAAAGDDQGDVGALTLERFGGPETAGAGIAEGVKPNASGRLLVRVLDGEFQ